MNGFLFKKGIVMKKKEQEDVDILLNGEEVTLPSEEAMNESREKEGPLPIEESLYIGLLQGEESENN